MTEKIAFLPAGLSQALRAAAPRMGVGAALGAGTGAIAAGEGHRLEGALGGAALGAGAGAASHHFHGIPAAAADPAAAVAKAAPKVPPPVPAAAAHLHQPLPGSRETRDLLGDIRGEARAATAPAPLRLINSPSDAQAHGTLDRLEGMLGKAASYRAGYADALESMGFEKEANVGVLLQGLRAAAPRVGARVGEMAGMGAARLGNAVRGGWGAFAQAAPRTAKGLQMAGNGAMHPATQFGTMMAPVVKGAL